MISRRYYSPAILILIAAYAVFFSATAIIRYRSFSFHDMDLAAINQTFWNAGRGVFVSPEYGTPALLSGHKWFIILPLLPLYLLLPGPPLLLVLQSAALAAGGWAVFLIARKLAGPLPGLALAFAYLAYPALQYVNLFEFHPIAFATPLLLYAFYFLLTRRWGWYLAFVIISLSVRQDVSIPVFALGVYALIAGRGPSGERFWRRWRWGLVPIVSALAWFYVCESLIPRLVPDPSPVAAPEMVESFFGWLGDSPGAILYTVFTRPGYVIRGIVTGPKLTYAWQLLSPAGFLPIFSPPGLLMVLLSMAEGLLSERFSHFSIRYQYSSLITPMVFAASCLGLKNLLKWRPLRGKGSYLAGAIVLVSLITAWSFGPIPRLIRQYPGWRFTREDAVRRAMVELVPPGAPVLATFEFTPQLSNRPQMFFFYHLYASSRRPDWAAHVRVMQDRADYVLADFNDWLTFYDFYTPGGDRSVNSFLREGNWELAATVNSLALFRRGERFAPGLAETVPAGEGTFRPVSGFPGLEAGPARAGPGEVLGFPVLEFSLDLRAARPPLPDILLVARLVNRADPGQSIQQFLTAPYRLYPPDRWAAGETVRIRANILLPTDLSPGTWDLVLFGLARKPGLQLPPEAAAAFYRHFDTAMALNYLPRMWGVPPDQLLDQHRISHLPAVLTTP
jgi:uncharacterized membrane protein